MINQGGESSAGFESNVAKKYHPSDMSQHVSLTAGHHSWSSSTGSVNTTWNSQGMSNAPIENGPPSSSGYHYYYTQGGVSVPGDTPSVANSTSHVSTSSSLGATNAAQDYASYASYPTSAQPYMYSNAEYQNYYNYHQPSNGSSSQQVGDCQNSGAPNQSFSSFQHTGSCVAPTSYSSTHYNAGDHQTTAGNTNNNYVNQPNYWNGGSSGSYHPHQYQYYTPPVANSTQVTSNVTANSHHYQQYNQWPYYYYPSAPAVSCAPGTENMSATSATPARPVQTASGGYPPSSNQPPPPGTTSWRTESGSSVSPFLQVNHNMTTNSLNGSSEVASLTSPSQQMDQLPSHYQKPMESSPLPSEKREDQQMAMHFQGPNLQASSTNQVLEHFQSPLQTTATVLDTCRVSKMQIPTNPRITSSLAFGMSKVDSSTANAAPKPAYVSVSVPKPSNTSHGDAEAVMKGTLPASLRAYVERTFARCKDDLQRAANQKLMKEVITKASADGTLFTRNWDIEPLFPLPSSTSDEVNQNVTSTTLPKFKRSPNRRMKSRWEPMADEKMAEKLASANYDLTKGAEPAVDNRKNWNNVNGWNGIKFVPSQQQTPLSKIALRPGKKPRFANTMNETATATGDASSDSDKEQGLTKYYASAIALADSPEEKKRREHRVKRFEKAKVNQVEVKHFRPKISGAGITSIRRESAMVLSKNSEASCSRAVEDIDWDALTVKGTCQEVEKRYLRLTSAPDPATVRPEEILEKALQMVQTSQKNYLYKCDQLKSIRQDLTVQRIINELTVKVYETHARLALEAGDLPEYNQCQSQLQRLYADGIQGCYMEFSAYNLLCVILHSSNNRDLLSAMARLSIDAKEDGAVKHALAVRSAVSSGNYIRFFRLYKAAPNLNTCLMDLYMEKMRFNAIKNICKSYRPTLPVSYIAQNLGFLKEQITDAEDKDASGLDECIEWLKAHGAVLMTDSNGELQLDTKISAAGLYMPEPEDAVAHGDATLAVDDFLTRAAS